MTILVRGGGPPEAFAPLNAYAVAQAATAEKVSNLVVGLGHAGTMRTALDEVAARCEPTPTAAAALVRDLLLRTGARAERALTALDTAVEQNLEMAGRIALARASGAFEAALRALVACGEEQMRRLDQDVEHSLLALAAPHIPADLDPALRTTAPDPDPDFPEPDDVLLAGALTLVVAAETGRVIASAVDAREADRILLQFPDGMVAARIEPHPHTHH